MYHSISWAPRGQTIALSTIILEKPMVLLTMGLGTVAFLTWYDVLLLIMPAHMFHESNSNLSVAAAFTLLVTFVLYAGLVLYGRAAAAEPSSANPWTIKSLDLLAINAAFMIVDKWLLVLDAKFQPGSLQRLLLVFSIALIVTILLFCLEALVGGPDAHEAEFAQLKIKPSLWDKVREFVGYDTLPRVTPSIVAAHKLRLMATSAMGWTIAMEWGSTLQHHPIGYFTFAAHERLVLNSVLLGLLLWALCKIEETLPDPDRRGRAVSEVLAESTRAYLVLQEMLFYSISVAWAVSLNGVAKRVAATVFQTTTAQSVPWLIETPDLNVGLAIDARQGSVTPSEYIALACYTVLITIAGGSIASFVQYLISLRKSPPRCFGVAVKGSNNLTLSGHLAESVSCGLGLMTGRAWYALGATSLAVVQGFGFPRLPLFMLYAFAVTAVAMRMSRELHVFYGKSADRVIRTPTVASTVIATSNAHVQSRD